MPDDAILIEKSELEIFEIINRMHKAGVRYEVIYGIFQELIKTLEMQGYAEDWLNQHNKPN